jgi:hypothetical protein
MSTPDESADVQGLKVYGYIARLAEKGATPAEIREKLIGEGVDPQEASRLADRLATSQAKKQLRGRAGNLLAQGVSPDQIQFRLIQEGFGQALVAEEVSRLLAQTARAEADEREDPRRLWRLLGAVLIVAGGGLFIGNTTGIFPTFSYAGDIVMFIGALVSAMGWLRSA